MASVTSIRSQDDKFYIVYTGGEGTKILGSLRNDQAKLLDSFINKSLWCMYTSMGSKASLFVCLKIKLDGSSRSRSRISVSREKVENSYHKVVVISQESESPF